MSTSRVAVNRKAATIILAVLAALGLLSFAFAGVTILENATSTATAPHTPLASMG